MFLSLIWTGQSLYVVDFNPNGVCFGRRGSLALRVDAGNEGLWINTDGVSAWTQFGTSVSGGGWTDAGVIVRLTTITDQVGIGTVAPAAGRKIDVTTTAGNQGIRVTSLLTSDNVLESLVSGEANAKLQILANAVVQFGQGGALALDTQLARTNPGILKLQTIGGGTTTGLELADGQTAAVGAAASARIRYSDASGTLQVSLNGAAYVDVTTGSATGGWTDGGAAVRLTTATDTVGIGTAAPVAGRKVHVLQTAANQGVRSEVALAGNVLFDGMVTADAGVRMSLTTAALGFGDGTGAVDWTLARTGAATATLTAGVFDLDVPTMDTVTQTVNWDLIDNTSAITFSTAGSSNFLAVNTRTGIEGLRFGAVATQYGEIFQSGGTWNLRTGSVTATMTNSSGIAVITGAVDEPNAAPGQPSGFLSLRTGNTDVLNAGGSGGSTGAITIRTGAALSTAGAASGGTGGIDITTGASADATSGNVLITIGTAGTTRGQIQCAGPVSTQESIRRNTTIVTDGMSPYTVLDTDHVLECQSTVAIVALLPAVANNRRRELIIANPGAGVVTIDGNAAETVLGAATAPVAAGQSLTIIGSASLANWFGV